MIGIKIPWQVLACAGLVGVWTASCFYSYFQGKHHVQKEWDASVERGKTLVEDLKKKQVVVTTKVETVYVDRVKVVKEKGDVIIKQIPIYIPKDTPDLPGGFRVLHDAAATNSIPDPSNSANAKAVSIADATETVSRNYEAYHKVSLQLVGLQDWVCEQAQLGSVPALPELSALCKQL